MLPFADVDKMEQRIIYLLNNDGHSREMGVFLHKRVLEYYTIEKNAGKILEVIESMILRQNNRST